MVRNGKVGIFQRFFLASKGKRDAKKNVICFSSEESQTTPFVKEEIAVCITRIHKEYEKYLKKRKHRVSSVTTLQVKKENVLRKRKAIDYENQELQKKLSEFSNPVQDFNNLLSYTESGNSTTTGMMTDIMSNQHIIMLEKQAAAEVFAFTQKRKVEHLANLLAQNRSINEVLEKTEKKEDVSIYKKTALSQAEYDVLIQKCIQHYTRTLARLSAYWSGVLSIRSDDSMQTIDFQSESILSVIQKEIETIRLEREREKNDFSVAAYAT